MTSSLFDTTIGAFEQRLALRRKMFNVTSVKLPKRRLQQDAECEVLDSIINCHECKSGVICASWLATATDGVPPPEFCPNRDTILRLKAAGYSKEPGK